MTKTEPIGIPYAPWNDTFTRKVCQICGDDSAKTDRAYGEHYTKTHAEPAAESELVDFGTPAKGRSKRGTTVYHGFKLADGTFVVDNRGFAPGTWIEVE